MFLKLDLLTVIVACITSCKSQHMRCNDKDIHVPWKNYDDWWKNCQKETSTSCQIVCAFKEAGILNSKNELQVKTTLDLVGVYPEEIRETMKDEALKCFPFSSFPKQFDVTCSEFTPFINCMRDDVLRHCSILKAGLFPLE